MYVAGVGWGVQWAEGIHILGVSIVPGSLSVRRRPLLRGNGELMIISGMLLTTVLGLNEEEIRA